MTPSKASLAARNALQRSLRAHGDCVAVCVAGSLQLERLVEALEQSPVLSSPEPPERVGRASASGSILGVGGRATNRGLSPAMRETGSGSAATGGMSAWSTEVIQKFGTGENLVVQLRLMSDKDVFAFRFGCIVFWGLKPDQLRQLTASLRVYMDRPLAAEDVEEEKMQYVLEPAGEDEDQQDAQGQDDRQPPVAVRQDQLILTTASPLERLAHSYALAQSVRLGVFEIAVDRSIARTRSIPETMAETGQVHLDARDLSRQMGGLLLLRCEVNLHTDILDTPDIFWDEERFEPHYVACRTYLDVDKRVDILNQRLGVLKDLYDLLQNSLNVSHGTKLEWIVIVLILVEVLLEFLELVHDAWVKS